MRLFPAVSSGTIRITHKPIKLAGYNIPAGQPILIPFWSIHRNPKLWADPESYIPERWLNRESAAGNQSDSSPAESPGSRCAGAAAAGGSKPPAAVVDSPATPEVASPAASTESSDEEYVYVGDKVAQVDESSDVLSSRDQDVARRRRLPAGEGCKPAAKEGTRDSSSSGNGSGLELKVRLQWCVCGQLVY